MQPKARLVTLLDVTGADVQDTVWNFVSGLSASFSCDALNTAVTDILGATCCDFGSAFFYSVVPWIGVVWSMCLCGCTGGMLGAKRFPKQLWGKHYQEDLEGLRPDKGDGSGDANVVIIAEDAEDDDERVLYDGEEGAPQKIGGDVPVKKGKGWRGGGAEAI